MNYWLPIHFCDKWNNNCDFRYTETMYNMHNMERGGALNKFIDVWI